MGPLVYLASPYSHPDPAVLEARFQAACRAAAALMRTGALVFSPIAHTHPIAMAGALPKGWQFWEALDRAHLANSCHMIVLCLDGWKESVGVQAELRIADELEIPVTYMAANLVPPAEVAA